MNISKPVFWHQGLFLQPQHFQMADLYAESLITPLQKYLHPYFWGVISLEISATGLENFSINIVKGEFLFSDGSHILFPGNALMEGRSFTEAWSDQGKPFDVYLGIREMNPAGGNVSVLSDLDNLNGVSSRYAGTLQPEEIPDQHESGDAGEVKTLRYILKIFWADEVEDAGDFILMPLTRIERDGDETKFNNDFIPPCLTIHSSERLLEIINEIKDQLGSRTRQLEEYKAQRGIQTAEFGARDTVYLLALRSLNRYVPMLYHLVEVQAVHPWTLFGLLRQLIGELSSFSNEINVLGGQSDGTSLLPGYDHHHPGPCFLAAQSLITRLLDGITAGPEYIIQLLFDGTYFAAEMEPGYFEGRNRYYLAVETEADPVEVIDYLQTITKLSSRAALPLLIARALPGVGLTNLQVPPQELPRRLHCLYFEIDHHSEHWLRVQNDNNIALYWDSAPEDLKIELMIVGRS